MSAYSDAAMVSTILWLSVVGMFVSNGLALFQYNVFYQALNRQGVVQTSVGQENSSLLKGVVMMFWDFLWIGSAYTTYQFLTEIAGYDLFWAFTAMVFFELSAHGWKAFQKSEICNTATKERWALRGQYIGMISALSTSLLALLLTDAQSGIKLQLVQVFEIITPVLFAALVGFHLFTAFVVSKNDVKYDNENKNFSLLRFKKNT